MPSTHSKPAGLPVLWPHADPTGDCLLARILRDEPHRREMPWPTGFEGGVCHRLDVSTSGAVLVADDPDELARIREQFAARALRKAYRFLASREVPWDENTCDRPLAHDRRHRGRMVAQRGPSTPHRGRWLAASTTFRRIRGALWEARMATGVMHQIRVHAAFVGLPLLGDRRYGGGATPDDAPPGIEFVLHHVGLEGAGLRTDPVPMPRWAESH